MPTHRRRSSQGRDPESTAFGHEVHPAAGKSRGMAYNSGLQKPKELLAAHTRRVDDRRERPLGEVASMHRHDDPVSVTGVAEDLMASSRAVELPTAALQRTHCLARGDGR